MHISDGYSQYGIRLDLPKGNSPSRDLVRSHDIEN